MQFRYLVFIAQGKVVGISYCQIHPFIAEDSLRSFRAQRESKAIGTKLRSVLARLVRFKALICGNLLLTGEYASYFIPEYEESKFAILADTWDLLFKRLQEVDDDLKVMFVKEFESYQADKVRASFSSSDYYLFSVQPSMVLKNVDQWGSFADYLASLKSKYRVRIKRALQRSAYLTISPMTLNDLIEKESVAQELMQEVLDQSEFRIVDLQVDYLMVLKRKFPALFQVMGYYENEFLVGFMSYFVDGQKLVAHMTGFDLGKNKDLDLYLNMLINLIDKAISLRCSQLILSRTALEIKSSIGAVPVPMINLLRHRSRSINLALPHVYQLLYRNEPWVQRNPFKH